MLPRDSFLVTEIFLRFVSQTPARRMFFGVPGAIDMKHKFDDYGVKPQAQLALGKTKPMQRRHVGAAACLASARDAVAGFARGRHIFGLTKGQFSMIDLAAAVLEITGPADVAVWTWCIAEYEVEAFGAFFADQRVSSLRVVMDWAGVQRDMPLIAELQERFGVDCIRVTKTHAKIVTVTTPDGWAVTLRGSMNLNANPRFEQFDISDDADILAVVHGMMAEMWSRGKSLPVGGLAHADAVDLLNVGDIQMPLPDWARSDKRWW